MCTFKSCHDQSCVVGQNPTLRITCPLAHCTLLHHAETNCNSTYTIICPMKAVAIFMRHSLDLRSTVHRGPYLPLGSCPEKNTCKLKLLSRLYRFQPASTIEMSRGSGDLGLKGNASPKSPEPILQVNFTHAFSFSLLFRRAFLHPHSHF